MFCKLSVLFTALCFSIIGFASDSIVVQFSQSEIRKGDTLSIDGEVPAWVSKKKMGTINILIEDVHHHAWWKLRYPVLNGYFSADIVFPDSIPADMYAINFKVQDQFFHLSGRVLNGYKEDSISNVVLLHDKELVSQNIALADKRFRMGRLLFENQAVAFFSPINNKNNKLDIALVTPLDSAYDALMDTTLFIACGMSAASADKNEYSNSFQMADTSSTLQNVVVTGKRKTAIDKFEEEYVTGLFQGNAYQVFDGLEDPQLSSSANIWQFLIGRVPGLQIRPDEDGGWSVKWRGAETSLYLDEMPADDQLISTIAPSEVAMIKVFQPPFMGSFGGGAGGAIAVYTRRGMLGEPASGPRNRFVINGYTPSVYTLPIVH